MSRLLIIGTGGQGKVVLDCAKKHYDLIINNIQIGANSIIGMGSVVIKDITNNVPAVGAPAKIKKHYKCISFIFFIIHPTASFLSFLSNPINRTLGINTAKKVARHTKNPFCPLMFKAI